MSVVDSEQEKQPISSVDGDNSLHSPGKEAKEERTLSIEDKKSTAETETLPVSCHNESVEVAKVEGDEDKTKEDLGGKMTVNGVNQFVDDQKNSEQSENLGESPVVETKPSETHQEVLDDKRVNGESSEVVAGKEGESKEAEQSDENVTMETNGEQVETSAKNKEAEQSQEAVTMDTNGEQGEALAAGKTSQPSPEPVAMETNEEVKVEEVLVPSEAESVPTEVEGQTEVEIPSVEKKRSVTIDSPVNVKEQDESEDKTKQGRSKTVGDVEGIATSTVKEDVAARSRTTWYTGVIEDTPSKSDSTAAEPEEAVSYSTSIVGGVVHRVPINTYSPKGQRKTKEGSPQTPPKKRSVIDTLFGRRRKSKGGPESPPGARDNGKEEDKENQPKFPESNPSSEDAEKNKIPESSPVTPKGKEDTAVEDAAKPLENGTSAEVEDTSGTETKQETEGKGSTEVQDTTGADVKQEAEGKAAVVEEGGGDVKVKPTVAEQSEEGVKEETMQDPKESKESETEPQDAKEESVPVESIPPEKEKKNAEEPKGEQSENEVSKDAVKQAHTEPSEEEKTSQPSPKKKKTSGILGGLFARRKSKKSKDLGDASPTAEKAQSDNVEEQQDGSPSAQPTSECTGTVEGGADQGVAPDAGDATAMNGQEDTATPKQEVSEGVTSPTVDQTVESVEKELTDNEIVGRQETETTETEKPEVESAVTVEKPEDLQKSPEENSPSKEADSIADKTAKDVALQETVESVTAQDNQPKAQQEGEQLIPPKIELSNFVPGQSEVAEEKTNVSEPQAEDPGEEKHVEKVSSPESEEAEEEDTVLSEPVALRKEVNPSNSPKAARHMQMRISYAEKDGEGGKEVEVIGTPERAPGPTNQKGKPDQRVSCRSLGEADHEGWLSKKGGMLFLAGWKRKWVVLKDGKLYYFKTAFDPEAGGIINMEGVTVAQAPDTKKKFCFKCEQPGAKPQVVLFMADNKEDMDKWLTVLAAASRGEVIQKPKQNQLTVHDEVAMRKRSGSNTAQRHSSVLAVGGRHDFLEDEDDLKATRRRSTPGSFSKDAPKETEEKGKETDILSVTPPAPSEAAPTSSDDQKPTPSEAPPAPSDTPPAPSDTTPAPSDTTPAPSDTTPPLSNTSSAPSDTISAPSDQPPAPRDTTPPLRDTTPAPSDTTPAPSDTTLAPSDQPPKPSGTTPASSDTTPEPSDEQAAPVDTPPISEPTDDNEESRTTNTITVMVDEVCVGSEKVVLEAASSVEVSTSEQESSALKSSDDTVPAVSQEEKKGTEGSSNICVDVTAGSEKQESPTDAESTVDKTDGALSVTTTESTVTVVETIKSSMEISETVETSTVVSVVETEVQSSPPATETDQLKPDVKEEVALSESSSAAPLESEPSETSPPDSSSSSQLADGPSESSSSPPESPSKTKWYFSLDRKQTWSVAPELEEENSSKHPKSSVKKSSDRGSIKSTSSDKGSIKSTSEDDQLRAMFRSIRQARLSIYGEHVLDGPERLRAFSSANESDDTLVRLKTLERTLKDKQQHLADLEELLSQPEINRKSICEWKIRNSVLLEELFPQEDIDRLEEVENAAEGGEGETQKKENVEKTVGEKEEQEENVEEKAEKLDEAKEEERSSKDQSDGNMSEKLSAEEEPREKTDEEEKSAEDKQQFVDKEENKEKDSDENLTEKVTEEQQKSPAESLPLPDSDKTLESETAGEKQEHEEDISVESSREVKSSKGSEGQQESEDTRL